MQVLCCDWLLEVRAGVWEADALSCTAPHAQLRAFQRDLHSLRRLSQDLPVVPTSSGLYKEAQWSWPDSELVRAEQRPYSGIKFQKFKLMETITPPLIRWSLFLSS